MLNFQGKKVTVMGLGLYQNGSGISAARFLVEQGAVVTVTDLKTLKELKAPVKKLKKFVETRHGASLQSGTKIYPIKFILGRHREQDFKNIDLVVKNPGVPNISKFLAIARKNKIPVETDISLFFQLVHRKRIIGITGTRGKSTTTTLIYEIIKAVDKNAVLGGNITKSPLAQLKEVQRNGPVILELSSWMLESLEPHKLSPHLAVVTNIYPDHLNTYAGMKDYIAAKENIFHWQNLQDYAVLNRDNKYTLAMGKKVPSQRFWFSLKYFPEENGCFLNKRVVWFRFSGREEKILDIKNIKILGEHNLQNILAAVCVGKIFGVSATKIKKVVKNFKGIPDRLEFLREIRGIKYYNDTTSTTPEATIAAVRALSPSPFIRGRLGRGKKRQLPLRPSFRRGASPYKGEANIILIAGGSDKGLDFRELAKEIKKYCKAVVLLKGTGTERLKKQLKIKNYGLQVAGYELRFAESNSMKEAVKKARNFSQKGDIILLSPACASFGLFTNEFNRGEQFKKNVKHLK